MTVFRLPITLEIDGPFLTKSTASGAYGVDATPAHDANGRPIVSFSLLKGRVLDAWRDLATLGWANAGGALRPPDTKGLLGADDESEMPAADGIKRKINRSGRLYFGDLVAVASAAEAPRRVRFRVMLDPETRAAKTQHLVALQSPWIAGDVITMCGHATLLAKDSEDAQLVAQQIQAGLRWAASLGGSQGIGFGRVRSVKVLVEAAQPVPQPGQGDQTAPSAPLTLTFKGPFCISQPQAEKNLFRSDAVVPGGVIKGALATMLRVAAGRPQHEPVDITTMQSLPPVLHPLVEHFAAIRILHAVPCASDKPRPPATPLSLIFMRGESTPRDVATLVSADQLQGVPAFQLDWKGDQGVSQALGQSRPQRSMRVRTAIDSVRRSAAKSQLFVYEMVDPGELVWRSEIDLGGVVDTARVSVRAALDQLLAHGLAAVGKAKTLADADVRTAAPAGQCRFESHTSQRDIGESKCGWIVVTQTLTLLADPIIYTAGSAVDAYDAAITELSGGSLKVVRTFARERLAGGEWLFHAYQKQAGKGYAPYLLTEPGSVLVMTHVTGQEGAAQECIETWRTSGIPLPPWAVERYESNGVAGNHWTRCPYIPQNGFGEIRVNMDMHEEWGVGAASFQTEASL